MIGKIKILKTTFRIGLVSFIVINLIAISHAYKFTHFKNSVNERPNLERLSNTEKLKALLLGVELPKPINRNAPDLHYEINIVDGNYALETWEFKVENSNKMIILFHGYAGEKSSLLAYSKKFNQMGFHTVLVDFRGSGGSAGNVTTLGYKEAKNVRNVYDFYHKKFPHKTKCLFGFSMGAVAILRACSDLNITPQSIILEAPYASLRQATINRFKNLGMPAHPFAEMLVFYGGIWHGFNAFELNSVKYASNSTIPCLLHRGAKDERVNEKEIDDIKNAYKGKCISKTFSNSGHYYYVWNDEREWEQSVKSFLNHIK